MTIDGRPRAHQRAQRDLDEGRAWKARDRLAGYLHHHRHDQVTLDRLGEISHQLGDLPTAGRYWALTTRDDAAAAAARRAFEERCGEAPLELLRQLDPRTPLEAYPPEVQQRISDLRRAVRKGGGWWEPRPAPEPGIARRPDEPPQGFSRIGEALFGTLLAVAFPGMWLVGIVTCIVLVVRLLR